MESNRKKKVYLIALPHEFREMALTYFDLLFFLKKKKKIFALTFQGDENNYIDRQILYTLVTIS